MSTVAQPCSWQSGTTRLNVWSFLSLTIAIFSTRWGMAILASTWQLPTTLLNQWSYWLTLVEWSYLSRRTAMDCVQSISPRRCETTSALRSFKSLRGMCTIKMQSWRERFSHGIRWRAPKAIDRAGKSTLDPMPTIQQWAAVENQSHKQVTGLLKDQCQTFI